MKKIMTYILIGVLLSCSMSFAGSGKKHPTGESSPVEGDTSSQLAY